VSVRLDARELDYLRPLLGRVRDEYEKARLVAKLKTARDA